jgi:branched-subunit amino acid ABC-type transport system permease component
VELVNFYLIPGLVLGCIYALGAVGVSLIYGVLRFGHFAHGDMMTLGAYVALSAVALLGLPALATLPIAMLVTAAVAVLVDRLAYRPFRRSPTIITVIASFGIALMLRSAIEIVWGAETQVYQSGIRRPMALPFGLLIAPRHVAIIGTAIVLCALLHLFLTRTRFGKAMRAVSDQPVLARIAGIGLERVVVWTWVLGGGLAAAAGVFLALDTQLEPGMGWNLLLPLYAAAILGGIGQPYGAIAGGLVIGLVEELSTYPLLFDRPLIAPSYKTGAAFVIMIAMLLWRPSGLFRGQYAVSLLTIGGIYAVLCLGLNLQWGMGGLFNAGISGFFAIGAYASAILTAPTITGHVIGFGLPVWIGMAAAMALSGMVGWGVARVCLNLKSDYLAMATIGIAEILRLVINNEIWLTNGSRGIIAIPRPFETLPGAWRDVAFLALVAAIVLGLYLAFERLARSPWGRVMRAIRDNEPAAAAAGKDVAWFRLQAFVLGSMAMGLAGALTAHAFKFIGPDATTPLITTFIVWVMVIAGGSGNNRGAILGALLIWAVWSATEFATDHFAPSWQVRGSYLRVFLIGLILQVILQRFPSGLLPERRGAKPRADQSGQRSD